MNRLPARLAIASMICLAPFVACRAESLASSASSAGSASLGSLSESVHGSSKSSDGGKQVADGDYQVIDVAQLPGDAGLLRFRLQLDIAAGRAERAEILVDIPQKAVATNVIAAGDIVSVRNRPYGLEFARAQAGQREPFFLALSDEWRSGLAARPLRF